MTKKTGLKLAFILTLALLLRLPGVFWGNPHLDNYNYFEPDELQHLDLAIEFMQRFDSTIFEDFQPARLNTLGFATQLGILGYPFMKIGGANYQNLLLIGRILSLAYALLLICCIFKICQSFFKEINIALWAALLLAIFDLNVTYSHYAIPGISYVFWAYFSVFLLIKFSQLPDNQPNTLVTLLKVNPILFLGLIISMSMTFVTKLDFVPILLCVIWVVFQIYTRKITFIEALKLGVLFGLLGLVFTYCAAGFPNDLSKLQATFDWLLEENNDMVQGDQHFLHNPVLYVFGVIGGTSLPIFLIACFGWIWLWTKRQEKPTYQKIIGWFSLFIILEFLVRWKLDSPFIRRCNIFLPFVAIMAGFGIQLLCQKLKRKHRIFSISLVSVVLVYTLLITLISQSNFVDDTRYRALAFLQQPSLEQYSIRYSPYIDMREMPKRQPKKATSPDLIVIHETYYRRYWKSFATPFKTPKCCEEVYHCASEKECLFYQKLLSGNSNYRLLQSFQPYVWLPERLFFKHLFGTYETFQGAVLIFKKLD